MSPFTTLFFKRNKFLKIACWHNLGVEHHFPIVFLHPSLRPHTPAVPHISRLREHSTILKISPGPYPRKPSKGGGGWGWCRRLIESFPTWHKRWLGHTGLFVAGWLSLQAWQNLDMMQLVPKNPSEGRLTHLLAPTDLELSPNQHPFVPLCFPQEEARTRTSSEG